MSRITWRATLKVVLRLAITLLFAPAILAKLQHPHEWGLLFSSWGYPPRGPIAVSSLEIVGLVLLWVPRLAVLGTGVLATTLTGATLTWIIHGPRATAAYPGTILLLDSCLAWLELSQGRWRGVAPARHSPSQP